VGTGEKKRRREVNQFLNGFLLKDAKGSYPLRQYPDAREMIAEYAEPIEDLFESIATRYSIAVFAWNLSIAPVERRGELLDSFLQPLVEGNEEGRKTISDLIDSLVERRETLYPSETLLILPDDSYKADDESDDESNDESLDE
jgi:hypothetical protein